MLWKAPCLLCSALVDYLPSFLSVAVELPTLVVGGGPALYSKPPLARFGANEVSTLTPSSQPSVLYAKPRVRLPSLCSTAFRPAPERLSALRLNLGLNFLISVQALGGA